MKENKARIQGIVDRMKEVIGVKSDVDLAEAIGASRSSPAVWKIRDRMPLAECVALAEKRGVSLDWLVLGRGAPGIEEPEQNLNMIGTPDIESTGDYVELPAFEMPAFIEGETAQSTIRLPRAWLEPEALGIVEGVNDSSFAPMETIAMRVPGNSMATTINNGDVVLVDRRSRDVDGVYVLRMGDSIRLRRVQRMHGGELHLLTDNPAYQSEIISADQVDAVEFIGYCFAILRNLR